MTRKKQVSCANCQYYETNYITQLDGRGAFRFGYCSRDILNTEVVDGKALRHCGHRQLKAKADFAS